jgi:hypothetical protein
MHRVHKAETLLDSALANQTFDSPGDIDKSTAIRELEPQILGERFHSVLYAIDAGPLASQAAQFLRSRNSDRAAFAH